MKKLVKALHSRHISFWNKHSLRSLAIAIGFLVAALFVQGFANNYVGELNGTAVGDLFLNNLPTVDIDFFIVQGALILTAIALFLFLYKPKYLSFGLKALAIFIVARSFLISLTHLGPSLHQLVLDPKSFGFGVYNILFYAKNDFFFSGHTGAPYLLALIFWPEKWWRYFFIGAAFVLGSSVLLAHIHYSIDVFAAPLITYSLFCLARFFFKHDYGVSRGDG